MKIVPKYWDPKDRQDHAGFFVQPDECLACGCCIPEAPGIFAWREQDLTVTVLRQPETAAEVQEVIDAMTICMAECIYYGGSDPKIVDLVKSKELPTELVVRLEKGT